MTAVSSPTERYLARVIAHLRTLVAPLRRDFIAREMEKWEQHYARFIETNGFSHRRGDGRTEATAFDFVETLGALEIMLAQESDA